MLNVGVELAALVIDEEHDELEVWIIPFEILNLLLDVIFEILRMNRLPNWFSDFDT